MSGNTVSDFEIVSANVNMEAGARNKSKLQSSELGQTKSQLPSCEQKGTHFLSLGQLIMVETL